MRNFGAKKFIGNQNKECANNGGTENVGIGMGTVYGTKRGGCGSKDEFDVDDQVDQNPDQVYAKPERGSRTAEGTGDVEMKDMFQCNAKTTQERQYAPCFRSEGCAHTKDEVRRSSKDEQHYLVYDPTSKAEILERLGHSLADSNQAAKHIAQEPKAIFSKKFIENPLIDAKALYQSKRAVLYKTEMCRSFNEVGFCKYGDRCQFCHSPSELRTVKRHPKYKTEVCKTFWSEGNCPYGGRCCFIHLEKINSGGADSIIADHSTDGTPRSYKNTQSNIKQINFKQTNTKSHQSSTDEKVEPIACTNSTVSAQHAYKIGTRGETKDSAARLFDGNEGAQVHIELTGLDAASEKYDILKDSMNDDVEVLSIINGTQSYTKDDSNIIKCMPDGCILNIHPLCEYYLPGQDSLNSGYSKDGLREGYFNDIFKYGSTLIKAARALEIDKILDQNYKTSMHSSCKIDGYDGIFSAVKSINDIKIEREGVWAKNFIRRWKDDPVFFIFDNKYDKL